MHNIAKLLMYLLSFIGTLTIAFIYLLVNWDMQSVGLPCSLE